MHATADGLQRRTGSTSTGPLMPPAAVERLGKPRWRIQLGPVAASWGRGRLDVFGVGTDQGPLPQASDWESLGGTCTSNPAAVSWGDNRIDCFVQGADHAMLHKSWDGNGGLRH
jgi:hypothetical protein